MMSRPSNRQLASGLLFAAASLIVAALAGLTMAAAAVGFWSIGGIRFEIFDHAVFWLSGPGATVVALTVSAPFLWTRVWAVHAPWCHVVRIAGGSALVVGAALVGWSTSSTGHGFQPATRMRS